MTAPPTTREENGRLFIDCKFATFTGRYDMFPGCFETVDPGAFEGQLEGDVRCLVDHVTHLVLGRTVAGTLKLWLEADGLHGTVEINPDDTDAMNLFARVKRGDVSQCSFGFEILEEREETTPTGDVHFILVRVKLYEVSIVTFPAYEDTNVTAREAQRAELNGQRLEDWKTSARQRITAK